MGNMKNKLIEIRRLEERLKYASPDECARLTKKIVQLRDDLL